MTRALRMLLAMVVILVALPATAGAKGTDQALLLARTRWRLVSIDGNRVPSSAEATLAFSLGGRVTGHGACNDLDGSWTHLGGAGISISDIAVGRDRCPGERGRAERRLLDQLILVTSFVITDGELTLTTTDGTRLAFRSHGRSGSELVGDWLLTAVDGDPAADIPRSTATFGEDGSVTGSGGCNTYRGRFGITDDAIRVRHLLARRATCADHVMVQEVGFLVALGEAASWSVGDDTLTLAGPHGRHSITLRAVRPVTHELTDTDWSITSISDGASAAASATIRFSPDGTLSGWGGCNTYRGPWSLDSDRIVMHIGPLMATRTTCAWEGVDLEASFLTTLEDVIGYKTPGGAQLILDTASGVRIIFDPPVTPNLTESTWRLTRVGDTPFEGMAPVNITFSDDGSFVGNGGCDLFWGSFELRGHAFRIIDVESGDRGCEQAVEEFQRTFLGLLPTLDGMAFDGADLILSLAGQPIRFSH